MSGVSSWLAWSFFTIAKLKFAVFIKFSNNLGAIIRNRSTMQDKPTPSFSNFMRDTDGEYSKARMLKAARELIAEGRRPDRVYRAMVRAAYELSAEYDDDGRFLRATGEWATGLFNDLSKELARLETEKQQAP